MRRPQRNAVSARDDEPELRLEGRRVLCGNDGAAFPQGLMDLRLSRSSFEGYNQRRTRAL